MILLGEKPYAELPGMLAQWHACIIPFKRTPLTEATNPVKIYEMLSAGMPVVAVDLPELRPMAAAGLMAVGNEPASSPRITNVAPAAIAAGSGPASSLCGEHLGRPLPRPARGDRGCFPKRRSRSCFTTIWN